MFGGLRLGVHGLVADGGRITNVGGPEGEGVEMNEVMRKARARESVSKVEVEMEQVQLDISDSSSSSSSSQGFRQARDVGGPPRALALAAARAGKGAASAR